MNFHGNEPLTTEFLLVFGDQEKPCPSYYGKDEDKKKVKMVLQQEIHPEVHAKWGNLMCHCQLIPKMRFSVDPHPVVSTKTNRQETKSCQDLVATSRAKCREMET